MRRFVKPSLAVWLALSFLAAESSLPAAPSQPVIPGFERFHTGEKADAARGGQLLLGELNCISCHLTEDTSARKQAPILDNVAVRVRAGHLRKFLRDPQAVKPGTTMPTLFADDPEREQKVESLVHFLASSGSPRQERPDNKLVAPGRDLYGKVGCVACHGTRDAAGNPEKLLPTSVPLGDLRAKYTIASLVVFLDGPHLVRPSGRMPKLLNTKEAREVANYLLQGVKVDLLTSKGGSNYRYYEGAWDRIPDFSKLKPKASGVTPGFDLGIARRSNDFGIQFDGVIKIDREAEYNFSLTSDDGSRLLIDGKLIVDNDGIHPPQTAHGKTRLTKGVHKVRIDFIQAGGGAELGASIDGAGLGWTNLGDLIAISEAALEKKPAPKVADEDALEFKPELVAKGKLLFASAGCASCHQMNDEKKPIASDLVAPALAKLKGQAGCLSEKPIKDRPYYALNAGQMKALKAVISTPPALDKTPAGTVARLMTTFNCYACHSRDKVGGPEEALDKAFQTTQPEMGDEGRLPPPLDGVGAKLTADYFKQMLDKGVHDRSYMHTRMPGFGLANVGGIVEAFSAIDKPIKLDAVSFTEPLTKVRTVGRHLSGNQAFGCAKCHTFNGVKAEGVQGIDMTLMPKRLQHDWFRAYVANPQSFRPGTRMPASFVDGKSQLANIFDGTANAQVEAIWLYLEEGPKARPPVGMGAKSIPLVPVSSAITYRNFISGAGSRAIAVGYPERSHLAFDANEMRLAMLWQGAFIDAARHWTDRGAGSEGPLGDNILTLPGGAPFAVLTKADAAWPTGAAKTLGYRFLGYKLTPDDRPTFLYSMDGIKVEDFPNPVAGKEGIVRRQFVVSSEKAADGLQFRAMVAGKIEPQKDGWYRIDSAWRLKIESDTQPIVRQSGGKTELLVPVRLMDGKAKFVIEYAW
jgi:mono/diheme cytochrome c family protein